MVTLAVWRYGRRIVGGRGSYVGWVERSDTHRRQPTPHANITADQSSMHASIGGVGYGKRRDKGSIGFKQIFPNLFVRLRITSRCSLLCESKGEPNSPQCRIAHVRLYMIFIERFELNRLNDRSDRWQAFPMEYLGFQYFDCILSRKGGNTAPLVHPGVLRRLFEFHPHSH